MNASIADVAAYTLSGLLFGLGGAAHCAGMCGGFPLALAALPGGLAARSRRAVIYNLGRGVTYIFLATLAAALGQGAGTVLFSGEGAKWLGRGLSILAGVVILITALWLLGVPLPLKRVVGGSFLAEQVAQLVRALLKSNTAAAPFVLGLLNGLLPCPLVYAMLLGAFSASAHFGNLWPGVAVGVGFALGTQPIMLSLGVFGAAIGAGARGRLLRVAGVLMIVVGLLTIARGIPALEPYMHFGH